MDKIPLPENLQQEDKFLNALAEAYRLQEAIIAATELIIISTTPEGIITSVNKAAEDLLGYSASELVDKKNLLSIHDAGEIAEQSKQLTESGYPVTAPFQALIVKAQLQNTAHRREWIYIRKDGTTFPVMVSITALWDEKDNLLGFASIGSDITEQRKSDKKIKESQEHLQALVSSLDDIVFELDEHARFTHIWVKRDEDLFLPRQLIYGRTLTEMFGEAFARPFEKGFQQVLQTGKTFSHEYKTLAAGEEKWLNARYNLIFDHGLPTNRVSVCIQDITPRKKAELSLRDSEERFRLLAENIPGTIYLCRNDPHYSMLFLNDNVEQLTGYTAEEFISGKLHFADLYHKDDKNAILEKVNRALTQKTSFHLQYRIHRRSGEIRWVEETGIGVFNGQGELQMIEGYVSDITERVLTEEDAHRIAEENDRIFNYSLGLNVVANFEGYLVKLNPAWERLLGWTLRELTSRKFTDFIHPEDLQKTNEIFQYVLEGNQLFTFENRYRCKNGAYRWLLWTSSPDLKRGVIYASAIDITDRKKFEDDLVLSKKDVEVAALELEEQNRQLDEFAHIISHNLRSPVGNIRALINFIDEKSTMEDYKIIFEKISKVANNLNETMNELMETLKVQKNTEVERSDLRFKDILDRVVQSLEGDLIQHGATVTFDFNDAPKITYSKTYLESIFQNLISNAVKYRSSDRTPEIHVSSSIVSGRVELRFRDNGLGIDLVKHGDKLFGLHKTFHEHKEARGVGLFLTKTQIEALGGTIRAESKIDEGTVFIIRF